MGIQLNAQHLGEVLAVLMPKPGTGAGSEKRRASRLQVEAPVTIWHMQDGVPGAATTVLTRDLSFSGIGFLQTVPPNSSGQFMLRLPRVKSEPVLLLCRITFTKLLADSLYVVGAEFIRVLAHRKGANSAAPAAGGANATAEVPTEELCEKVSQTAQPARLEGRQNCSENILTRLDPPEPE